MKFKAFLIVTTALTISFQADLRASAPVVFEADQLVYDQGRSLIRAKGDVRIMQDGQTLQADQVIYRFNEDSAFAEGHVILTDTNGDTHSADRLELTDQMREGLVLNLQTQLKDGSRLWAEQGVRVTPQKHVLKKAGYTPCKPCETDPEKAPAWALKASQVTHDADKALITYENARFEAWGVPIFYTPYFAHPDGSVPQKSGFLTPQAQFSSDDGFNVTIPYYWAISPSLDATIGLRTFTKETPQLTLETRKRLENASFEVQTSFTESDRTDSVNGSDVKRGDEFRGHVAGRLRWDMTDHWRSGADIALATDEQYLNQYDISDEDVLENRIYAERFDMRDYASVELLAFQDLRLDANVDQPNALPYANMQFLGDPNAMLGGRWQWTTSFLSLNREGNEQDMNRVSSAIGWQRQDILPIGLVSTVDLSLRGDSYYVTDRDIAKINPQENDDNSDSRLIPTANLEVSYPLQKQVKRGYLRVKPRVGLTARPDIDNDSAIPNEDSSDTQLDITNLFKPDRFPGLDVVEDRTRVNYALEGGYYTNQGNEFTAAIGQSYRFDNDDNPFQEGSGLEAQSSDIVGQIAASFDRNRHNLNYRFQVDGRNLLAERHEFYGSTSFYNTDISAIYLFEKGSEGTEFEDSRQQVQAGVTHRFNDTWSVASRALYDIGKEDQGLREARIGLSYDDECFGITTEVERDLQREASGANDTSVFFRLRLKNLGEFETKAYERESEETEGSQP